MAASHHRSVFVKSRRRKHLNKMTPSIVHLDLELNESVEVGDEVDPVVVDPDVDGKPLEGDVPSDVDQDVEIIYVP